eukprot:TRINITY_DN72963_c0_g1_i1.p1 TRINITY_DN72963_c0_g1~~TRINITY_DN72963_c0_g1_i1.p1  ORF type:complete len:314 (+),score=29.57 TRINITY_DN72963_c0_g1_i1:123-1064(+)
MIRLCGLAPSQWFGKSKTRCSLALPDIISDDRAGHDASDSCFNDYSPSCVSCGDASCASLVEAELGSSHSVNSPSPNMHPPLTCSVLRGFSIAVATRVAEAGPTNAWRSDTWRVFELHDRASLATEADVYFFTQYLLACPGVSDTVRKMAFIGAYSFMGVDVPINNHTWKPIIVTAMVTATRLMPPDEEMSRLQQYILSRVICWWPTESSNRGLKAFEDALPPSAARYVSLYFELKDLAYDVELETELTNDTSTVCSFGDLPPSWQPDWDEWSDYESFVSVVESDSSFDYAMELWQSAADEDAASRLSFKLSL